MPMPRSLGGTKMPLSVSHTVSSAMTMRPASGRSSPARQRSVVVLPQPDGPEQRDQLAGVDADADAVDRVHHHVAGRHEGLAQIFDGEHEVSIRQIAGEHDCED